MKPYFITGLPRSRTAWLANLLTWGDSFCFHEATDGCGSIEDLKGVLASVPFGTRHVGNSDPNLGLVPEALVQTFPGCRVVSIYRPLDECVQAEWHAMNQDKDLMVEGMTMDGIESLMRRASDGIAHILKALPKDRRMIVLYDDLDREATVKAIWRFCVPNTSFPQLRYEMLQDLRVTQIFSKVLKRHPTQPFRKLIEDAGILETRAAVTSGA